MLLLLCLLHLASCGPLADPDCCTSLAGAELASAVRHQGGERGVMLMLLTAAAINALKDTGVGFLAGELLPLCTCSAWGAASLHTHLQPPARHQQLT